MHAAMLAARHMVSTSNLVETIEPDGSMIMNKEVYDERNGTYIYARCLSRLQ
jgi:hypothetical protein